MKTFLRLLLLFVCVITAHAQSPKYEMRAVWLTTIGGIDWPHNYATSPHSINAQKRELTTILDQLRRAGVNTVLLQTRIRSTTIFPSGMEPWDGCLAGTPGASPGYDPLQFAIDECHKRGMQCHAWIVTIPVGKWNADGCRQLRKKLPKLIVKIGDEGYMNPEKAETGDYLARFCREVTRRYDIDGVHLDYIRYPETWRLKVSRQQGRHHITSIVRRIAQAVRQEKPWVMLSCSPIGKYDDLARYNSGGWNANTTVCQDAQAWLREGLMDALMPMMYFQGNNFFPFAVNWKEFAHGRIVAPGLAVYMLHPRERNWSLDVIEREMYVLREQGLGHTFFRSKFLTDNTKGVYQFTQYFNQAPALVPPMDWTGRPAPYPARQLNLQRGTTTDRISWSGARDNSGADYLLYNIYASEQYPVDTQDPRNLISIRQRHTQIDIPHGGRTLNYAVTTTDRYGRESAPIESQRVRKAPVKADFRQLIMGKPRKRYKRR